MRDVLEHIFIEACRRGGHEVNARELARFLGAGLPKYMLPDHFQELAQIPRSPSGKVDRAQLEQRPLLHASPSAPVEAATQTESRLIELWEQRLQRGPLSRLDNFFELGGHSLLAMWLVADIERRFATRISIADLFENPTPELMARRLLDERAPAPARCLVPIQPLGNKPPLF